MSSAHSCGRSSSMRCIRARQVWSSTSERPHVVELADPWSDREAQVQRQRGVAQVVELALALGRHAVPLSNALIDALSAGRLLLAGGALVE